MFLQLVIDNGELIFLLFYPVAEAKTARISCVSAVGRRHAYSLHKYKKLFPSGLSLFNKSGKLLLLFVEDCMIKLGLYQLKTSSRFAS